MVSKDILLEGLNRFQYTQTVKQRRMNVDATIYVDTTLFRRYVFSGKGA